MEFEELFEFEFDEPFELELEELFEFELDEPLEFEFDELFELEFEDPLEFEFEELFELEFDEPFELEFDELLPANCWSFSAAGSAARRAEGAVCVRSMLRIPPVSVFSGAYAACDAPVAPVTAAKAKATAAPIL